MKVASLDNLLFFLLIAAAALFQLLSKVLSKTSKNPSGKTSIPPTREKQTPIPKSPAESDAERVRKFLEALGQPPSSTPPRPVLPRTDIPPRALAPVQPPPVIPGAWRFPREQRRKPKGTQNESPSPEERPFPPPVSVAAARASELHESAMLPEVEQQPFVKTSVEAYAAAGRPITNFPDLQSDIASLLASKSGLRKAIILREIFGPPPGLREPGATM